MNAIRATRGLKPLRFSARLRSAATAHSTQMALRGFFGHESLGGGAFWRRIERYYPSRGHGSWTVGENILWMTGAPSPLAAVRQWMLSPPHRQTILGRSWRDVGVSAVYATSAPGVYGGRAVTIVTADFGARG